MIKRLLCKWFNLVERQRLLEQSEKNLELFQDLSDVINNNEPNASLVRMKYFFDVQIEDAVWKGDAVEIKPSEGLYAQIMKQKHESIVEIGLNGK